MLVLFIGHRDLDKLFNASRNRSWAQLGFRVLHLSIHLFCWDSSSIFFILLISLGGNLWEGIISLWSHPFSDIYSSKFIHYVLSISSQAKSSDYVAVLRQIFPNVEQIDSNLFAWRWTFLVLWELPSSYSLEDFRAWSSNSRNQAKHTDIWKYTRVCCLS